MYCDKIVIQSFGSVVLVGIQGTPEQIETQFNSFYNFGLCRPGSNLEITADKFGVIWSTPARIEKYCRNSAGAKVHQEANFTTKGAKEKIRAEIELRRNWFVHHEDILKNTGDPYLFKNSFNDVTGGRYKTRTTNEARDYDNEFSVEDLATEATA
jgi:hypothetical protein